MMDKDKPTVSNIDGSEYDIREHPLKFLEAQNKVLTEAIIALQDEKQNAPIAYAVVHKDGEFGKITTYKGTAESYMRKGDTLETVKLLPMEVE